MNSPPRGKPGELVSKAGRKLITKAKYNIIVFLAKLFEQPFWFFEEQRSRLMDHLDNERGERK